MSHKVKNKGIVSKNVQNYFKNHFSDELYAELKKR